MATNDLSGSVIGGMGYCMTGLVSVKLYAYFSVAACFSSSVSFIKPNNFRLLQLTKVTYNNR